MITMIATMFSVKNCLCVSKSQTAKTLNRANVSLEIRGELLCIW